MPDRAHIGLDNPAFHGRLRHPVPRVQTRPAIIYKQARPSARYVNDVIAAPRPSATRPEPKTRKTIDDRSQFRHFVESSLRQDPPAQEKTVPTATELQQFTRPAAPKQQRSHVLRRQLVQAPTAGATGLLRQLKGYSRLQMALVGMACFVFVLGLTVGIQGLQANHAAAAQISVLSQKPKPATTTGQASSGATAPSTTKPAGSSLSQYVVAPDLPRYLKIPKLGVYSRVLQVG